MIYNRDKNGKFARKETVNYTEHKINEELKKLLKDKIEIKQYVDKNKNEHKDRFEKIKDNDEYKNMENLAQMFLQKETKDERAGKNGFSCDGNTIKKSDHEPLNVDTNVVNANAILYNGNLDIKKDKNKFSGSFTPAILSSKEKYLNVIKFELGKCLKMLNCAVDVDYLKTIKTNVNEKAKNFFNDLKNINSNDRLEVANKINSFVAKTEEVYDMRLKELEGNFKQKIYNNLLGEQMKKAENKRNEKIEKPILQVKLCEFPENTDNREIKESDFKLKPEELFDMAKFVDEKLNKKQNNSSPNLQNQFELLEEAAAKATKKFWQAKRELMIVNKVLEKTYSNDNVELSDNDKNLLNSLFDKMVNDNLIK